MCCKRLLVGVAVLVCGLWTLSPAVDIGAGAGYGSYTLSAYGFSMSTGGVSASVNADFPGGSRVASTSASISYWSGSFFGMTMTDITIAEALKVSLSTQEAQVRPYFGMQVAYHFLSAEGSSGKDLGIGAFAGVAMKVAPSVRIPIQAGYDYIIESGASAGAITFRGGVLFDLSPKNEYGYY